MHMSLQTSRHRSIHVKRESTRIIRPRITALAGAKPLAPRGAMKMVGTLELLLNADSRETGMRLTPLGMTDRRLRF